jgi:hypothetical protein
MVVGVVGLHVHEDVHEPGRLSGTPSPPHGTWATSQAGVLAGMCAGNHAWPEVRDRSPMARARPGPSVGANWKGCGVTAATIAQVRAVWDSLGARAADKRQELDNAALRGG